MVFTGGGSKEMALNARSSPLLGVSLLVGVATLFATAFLKLYRARMLLIERRRKGLVSISFHLSFFGKDLTNRPFAARCTRSLILVWTSSVPQRLLGPDTKRCSLSVCFRSDWCR